MSSRRLIAAAVVTAVMMLTGAMPAIAQPANSPPATQPAPDPAALQAAQELFDVLSKDMITQLSTQMIEQLWPIIAGRLPANVDAAARDDLKREFARIQLQNMQTVMKDAPVIYARHFTVAELHDMTAFYRTATGQKALHEMPTVMAESMQTVMPRLQAIEQETEEAFDKILRERGYIK